MLSLLGLGALFMFAMGIRSAIHEPGVERPAEDIGATTIAMVVPRIPPAPAAERQQPPPETKSSQPAIAQAAVPAAQYVRHPAVVGELTFATPERPKPVEAGAGASAGGQAGPNVTTVAFKPATLAGSKAGPALDMTYVLRPQHIPCVLDTAMDSSLPGSIECHTTADVRSQMGVLLMPAGTSVQGAYKADVRTGQSRLFAFVGSAITPEGIPVPLDAGVSDGMGMSGIPGDVDNHWGLRFGAAILLSVADAAVSLGTAALSKAGSTNLNISGGGASLAQEALRQSIDIPPTITVPPGAVIHIVVTKPIDFSDAIKVTTRAR
jgi:type IV secretion system protein VirB10